MSLCVCVYFVLMLTTDEGFQTGVRYERRRRNVVWVFGNLY